MSLAPLLCQVLKLEGSANKSVPAQQMRRRRRRKRGSCWRAVFLPWLKRHFCTWNLFTQYMLYFVGIWVYLLVGGFLFWLIEHQNEEEELEEAVDERNRFTAELANDLNQTYRETEELIEYISTLCDQDVFIGELHTIPRKWEYGPSVFFAMTVITTIGYGDLAPVTSAGRTLFCFYALFGIPLFLFFMALLGKALSDAWDRTVRRWIIRNNKSLKYISFLLLIALGFVIFLGVPAILFAIIDELSYTTSLYFVAVTLTTVGFGDILPTGPRDTFIRSMYLMGTVGWLFLGLTFASVVFTKVSSFYEKADNAIATTMVSGLAKRRRFHPCGCLRGQDCTAKVKAVSQVDGEAEAQTDEEAQADEEADEQLELQADVQPERQAGEQPECDTQADENTKELEGDVMKLNDVEDSAER